jgi:chloramphenicol O-acetyltransferase type A
MTASEPRYLDLDTWPRRAAFDYFRAFDKPFFNVCVRVDVAPLKAAAAALPVGGFVLACHFVALRLCNRIEPFRYRLEGDRVRVHEQVQGGTTVLRDDQSFGFAYLGHETGYAAFAASGAAAMAAARHTQAAFDPRLEDDALIHFGSLPWLHFTSFAHARHSQRGDSVPKIMFGRADPEGSRLMLPLSVEVHHALMDGVHVGQYVQAFEDAAREPGRWLRG